MIVVVLAVAALALGAPGCAPPEEPAEEAEPAEGAEPEADPEPIPSTEPVNGDAPYVQGEVNVVVSCPTTEEEAVTVSVNPWTYKRSKGANEASVWVLKTSSTNDTIEIRPVRPEPGDPDGPAYPFTNDAPQSNANRLEVPADQLEVPGTYYYEIVVYCDSLGDNPSEDHFEVVLDPKMEIMN